MKSYARGPVPRTATPDFPLPTCETGSRKPTELEGLLRSHGIERVVIIGLATDYCVKETALDALRIGFVTTVLREGIRAVNLKESDGERALEEIRQAGALVE